MNKIISSSDADALDRLREKNQRDIKKSESQIPVEAEKQGKSSPAHREIASDEIAVTGNRLMLRQERTLQGLLAVKNLFERPADDREAQLTALIDQTRFQDEPVLKDYEKTLQHAVRDNDRAALDYLVLDFQNKLQASAKDQIIRENLQAASSLMPEELLRDVVRSLKRDGLPHIAIAPQRAIELLQSS
jgi:hypothetical protein